MNYSFFSVLLARLKGHEYSLQSLYIENFLCNKSVVKHSHVKLFLWAIDLVGDKKYSS